jgi:hypothetical protein
MLAPLTLPLPLVCRFRYGAAWLLPIVGCAALGAAIGSVYGWPTAIIGGMAAGLTAAINGA